jgi:hypothetical protein
LLSLDDLELWCKFLAARSFDDGPRVAFILRIIHEQPLPAGLNVRMQIGPHVQQVHLDEQGNARWSLSLEQVQDARTYRVQRPIVLTVSRE